MSAATAPQEINDKFAHDVKKSSKQAEVVDEEDARTMDHKDEIEKPSIGAAIKDKAETVIHKVADVVHRITDTEPRKEGQMINSTEY